jgi:hypothetical protein
MTKDEAERIDALIAQVAEWRVEMHDETLAALKAHQDSCLIDHISPLASDMKLLVEDMQQRQIEAAQRKRWRRTIVKVGGGILTATGVLTPILIYLF